jgi:hypothetical protein
VTELSILRAQIPETYKKVRQAMLDYRKYQNLNQLHLKNQLLKELFRQIEEELKLATKFSSQREL